MTTDLKDTSPNFELLNENLSRIEELSQRLVSALAKQKETRASLQAPGPDLYTKTAAAYWTDAMTNPAKVMEQQMAMWQDYMNLSIHMTERMLGKDSTPVAAPAADDRRFSDDDWQQNPVFDYVKQSYLIASKHILANVDNVDGMDML